MKGEAQNFNWFKDRLFEIPFFQRPYVWKEDNWEELWNNIVFNSSEEMPFIGSFILQIKSERGLVDYVVIDGQQRLTTLSILIKAFLDSSNDLKNNDKYSNSMNQIESFIMNVEYKGMETTKSPRVTPSSIDKNDFLGVMNGTLKFNEITNNSHSILRCYKYFMNKFEYLDADERRAIGAKFLSDIKFFIAIELDSKDDEQKIFDSVNRLGMKLLNSDIIKNNLYQRLKEIATDEIDINEVYNKNWKDVYQSNDSVRQYWEKEITVGRFKGNQLDEFLKDYATIKGIYVSSQTGIDGLAKAFKDYTNQLDLASLLNFIEEITSYANIYVNLFNRNIEETCFEKYDNLNVLLLTLKVTKTSTFNPYILKLIHDKPSNLEEILFNLEKFIIKRLIYKLSVKNYNKVCEQLLKTDNAIRYLDEYSDDAIDYSIFPSGLSSISNENAKLLLLIIELIKRKNIGDGKFSTLTKYSSFQLEHILPKKWKTNWSNVLCYNSDGSLVEDIDLINVIRELKIMSIGNMTLLKDKLNGSISNSDFKTKIKGNGGNKPKDYGIEMYVGGLLVAKEIVDSYNINPEWNEKNIYERDTKLFNVLNDYFNFVTDVTNVTILPIKTSPKKNIEIHSLDEVVDFSNKKICSFVLLGKKFDVKSGRDMLVKFLEELYYSYNKKEKISELAISKFKIGPKATTPLLTYNKSDVTSGHEIGDSQIYVETNRNYKGLIDIIKCFINEFELTNDAFVFYTINESLRQTAFDLVNELVINKYLSKDEIKALSTQEYTRTIIKSIKNPLIAFPSELNEHEWKKERYSKEIIEYDGIKFHVNNQFTKDALDELIAWYNKFLHN